jgi:hypothetical protein
VIADYAGFKVTIQKTLNDHTSLKAQKNVSPFSILFAAVFYNKEMPIAKSTKTLLCPARSKRI